MPERAILTPAQVSLYIKSLMDGDPLLSALLVQGELSNYKLYPSGHHYFTLKDGEGSLRCVMFRSDAASLRFRPENGMRVLAAGRVTVFPRDGQYQLYCTRLIPQGAGDLHAAFEALKQKLQAEGLFDPERKKPLPLYPERIALITSPAGAAVRDMIRILGARSPQTQVFVLPVRVQGEGAAREIAAAIAWANRVGAADLLITGRGGGSMEDLWAFNEEPVARAIAASMIPVISAVGHEPDVTIADYVADLRAATPSNAAELAVPDRGELLAWLSQAQGRMAGGLCRRLEGERKRLNRLADSRVLRSPDAYLQDRRLLLDYQSRALGHAMGERLSAGRERFARLAAGLEAMSPLKVLGRGYAIPLGRDGGVVASVAGVSAGDTLDLRLADGSLSCRVEEVFPGGNTERTVPV